MPLPRTRAILADSISAGVTLGVQIALRRHGKPLASFAVGLSRLDPARDMTPADLLPWLSAGKPVTAVAILQLWEQRRLHLDDPVVKFIPEFAPHGKDAITLRHCLTHTAGIRAAVSARTPQSPEAAIAQICNAKLEPNWTPGQRAGYHAASTWYILGEIIRRITHTDLATHYHNAIFAPAGMPDSYIGMPTETFAKYGDRMAELYEMTLANPLPTRNGLDSAETARLPRPASNARGTADDLALFYDTLLHQGTSPATGNAILNPTTVEAATARHRTHLRDETFKSMIDFGLGFILNSRHHPPASPTTPVPYGYGPHASHRTFGHSGNQSSVAFADPDHALAAAILFNTMPGDTPHQSRIDTTLAAIYADLGLA